MTTTVPLSALATSVEDIDSELTPRFLFPAHDVRLMEYLWGLEIHTIDPTHERSVLYIRKSTETPFRNGINGSWFLIPTEETLGAMRLLQERNITVPISERTSFLDEFAAQEYEYIFIPDDTDIDFLVLEAESAPQRFSAPYTDFPQVTSSANPFFVTFHARPRNVPSVDYRDLEFLLSCYPPTLITLIDHGSKSDLHHGGPGSKSGLGSDETAVTPDEEGPSFVPAKEEYVRKWVQRDVRGPHEPLVLCAPRAHRRRKQQKIIPFYCPSIPVGKPIWSEGETSMSFYPNVRW